jgi:CRISPR system Cascade subunit CasE
MIASLYRLSRRDIVDQKVTDDYSLHRIVYDLFPENVHDNGSRDFLYADKGGGYLERVILILSRRPPMEPKRGTIESREVPVSFLAHERYAFEVVANPSRRDGKTGKTIAVLGEEALRAWFEERSRSWGFAVDAERLQISRIGVQRFEHKGEGIVVHGRATFSGLLAVTDREVFVQSFENGIGRCRGFGFGLLQLRPVVGAVARA